MLSLIHPIWRRLEFASAACIAFSFWTLAVLVHIKLQGGLIESLVLGGMLLCCLLLLGFVNLRRWRSLGTPGLLLLASIASYIYISSVASLAADSEPLTEDLARQGFFLVVTLAAILGGRWLLERIGVETLLKWTLVILVASCAVTLASQPLREIGALPEYRLPYRMTGTFTDPNDAGFIACITAALALALPFRSNRRQRLLKYLGYLALVLGCAAGFSTFSHTAVGALGVILTLFLLVNVRRLRRDLLHTGLTVLCLAGVLVYFAINLQIIAPAVRVGVAGISSQMYEEGRAGWIIRAHLVHDGLHRADDDPVQGWHWQRADALPDDPNAPDEATWTDIERGSPTYEHTITDADIGKFLFAYVYYEKEGETYLAQTIAVGPITTPGEIPPVSISRLRQTRATIRGIRGESTIPGGLPRRMELWQMGAGKVLDSPIVGNGLYQLHHMEGASPGYHGMPEGVHNVYLMLIGEAGIVPLAIYALALFFLIRVLWTTPRSIGRDSIVLCVIVMGIFSIPFQHLLTMGAYNFLIGLTCALAAFLTQECRTR